jgi:hypothetical protein
MQKMKMAKSRKLQNLNVGTYFLSERVIVIYLGHTSKKKSKIFATFHAGTSQLSELRLFEMNFCS